MAMNSRNLLTIALALLLSAAARAQDATSETSEKTPLLWPASLEQYHKRFAEFDKQDAENMPAPGCTVFAGSSAVWIPQIRKAFAGEFVLRNSAGQLCIDPSGAMRFTTESVDCPVWTVQPDQMWLITLAKGESPFKLSDAISFTPGNQNVPKFSAIEKGAEFRYDSLRHGEQIWDVGLTLRVRRAGDEFEFLAKVENRASGWCVQHFQFPILFDIRKSGADHQGLAVLLPSCLGERVATPKEFGKLRRFNPTGSRMRTVTTNSTRHPIRPSPERVLVPRDGISGCMNLASRPRTLAPMA